MKKGFILLLFLFCGLMGYAQKFVDKVVKNTYNPDSVRAELDRLPYFTLFRDNYFIGGTTLGHRPSSTNSDVKFQISVAQRLTKSFLPFNSYLFIMYTQKTFWNVFQKSLPMHDMNFNPGIGFGHLIVYHDKFIGKGYLIYEHESNGRDSIQSRSWNRITLSATVDFNHNWNMQFKIWAPFLISGNNKDILKYKGLFQIASHYSMTDNKFRFGILLTKRKDWTSFNTQIDVCYKFNNNENQYIYLQYYNGYGEDLLDYNKYHNMLRVGFVITPRDFSIF